MSVFFYCACFLTIVTICLVSASSHNLSNRNLTDATGITVNVQSQRFIRHFQKFYDLNNWSHLYVATSRISLTMCANLCMENDECVCFSYLKLNTASQNCHLGNKVVRSDLLITNSHWDYFELEVRKDSLLIMLLYFHEYRKVGYNYRFFLLHG